MPVRIWSKELGGPSASRSAALDCLIKEDFAVSDQSREGDFSGLQPFQKQAAFLSSVEIFIFDTLKLLLSSASQGVLDLYLLARRLSSSSTFKLIAYSIGFSGSVSSMLR